MQQNESQVEVQCAVPQSTFELQRSSEMTPQAFAPIREQP
jgi:hypothetical protein